MPSTSFRIQFYADSATVRNKLFTFKVNNRADALASITRFRNKGLLLRAFWFQSFNNGVALHQERLI